MTKLARYLKPYLASVALCIALLLLQASCDLTLPNYMSDIVNTGIQKGGISTAYPEVASENGLALLTTFMPEQDATFVKNTYTAVTRGSNTFAELEKSYTNLPDTVYLARNLTEENSARLDAAFGRASYAFVTTLSGLGNGSNVTDTSSDGEAPTSIDMTKLYAMLPMLQSGMVDPSKAIADAATLPETTYSATGALFVKGFYQELGADTAGIQTRYLLAAGGRMLGVALVGGLASVAVGLFASRVGAGVARNLRKDLFSRISRFSNTELDHFSAASLITRTTNDVTQVQMLVTMGLRMLCYAPIMGVGGIFMALSKSPQMSWVLGVGVCLIMLLIFFIYKVAMPHFRVMQNLVDRLNLVTRENLSGLMVVRAFGTQKFEEGRFDKANLDLNKNNLFVNRVMAFMMPAMNLVMNMLTLLIIWVGGKQIAASTLQVGDMMAFMQYAMQIMFSFLMISMMFIMVPRAAVSGSRISEVLSTEITIADPPHPIVPEHPLSGRLEFQDVSFKYGGADENVLEHISFTARPGETTAFIGSTGSGKSTLINLIPRFYDVTEGRITIDGIDVRDLPLSTLRQSVGYVPQKGLLFSGDIADNLRYGKEDATEEELNEAVRIAQAEKFISEKPEGYATEISQGGTNVSGGQRQRLSIARALVKKAPICIFDDSFSALDFKTDAALRKALHSATTKSAVLIVAQRISTIMHAQQIIVLADGRIVGKGTHEELLKTCETYQEIAKSQLTEEELQ